MKSFSWKFRDLWSCVYVAPAARQSGRAPQPSVFCRWTTNSSWKRYLLYGQVDLGRNPGSLTHQWGVTLAKKSNLSASPFLLWKMGKVRPRLVARTQWGYAGQMQHTIQQGLSGSHWQILSGHRSYLRGQKTKMAALWRFITVMRGQTDAKQPEEMKTELSSSSSAAASPTQSRLGQSPASFPNFCSLLPPEDQWEWVRVLVIQLCPALCDPMDCSLPGSSVHGIFQARVLQWGAIAFSWCTV